MGGYLRRGFRFSQSCTVRISSGSAKTQTVQSVRCCLLRFMDRGGVLPLACVFIISYIIPQKFSSCKILCTGLCEITPKINFLFHPMIFFIHFLRTGRHKKGSRKKTNGIFPAAPQTACPTAALLPAASATTEHKEKFAFFRTRTGQKPKETPTAAKTPQVASRFKAYFPLYFSTCGNSARGGM